MQPGKRGRFYKGTPLRIRPKRVSVQYKAASRCNLCEGLVLVDGDEDGVALLSS